MTIRPDPFALDVVGDLKRRLIERFGDRLAAVYLFGSRARGDNRPDSDADVAVFLRDAPDDLFDLEREIIEDSYDLLLERGLYIQPWAFDATALMAPESARLPGLRNAVLRDGIRL